MINTMTNASPPKYRFRRERKDSSVKEGIRRSTQAVKRFQTEMRTGLSLRIAARASSALKEASGSSGRSNSKKSTGRLSVSGDTDSMSVGEIGRSVTASEEYA